MIHSLFSISRRSWRVKKWRTIFSILGATCGIALLVGMMVLYGKMDQAFEEQFIARYGNSDMMVGYRHDRLILKKEQVEQLLKTEGVAENGQVLVNPQQYSQEYDGPPNGIYYLGADNSSQSKMFYKFTQDLMPGEVSIAGKLAKRLNVQAGDTVEIPFPSGKTQTWKVKEILPAPVGTSGTEPEFAIFHLETLQERFGLQDQLNLVLLKVEPGVNKNHVAFQLRDFVAQDIDIDMMEGLKEARRTIDAYKAMGYTLGILALISSALFVLSNLQVSLQERIREWAVLRAIGASKKQVFRLVLIEATLVGGCGALLGLIGGVWLADLSSTVAANWMGVAMTDAPLHWGGLVSVALGGWLFLMIVSLLPARRTASVMPIQAVRESTYDTTNQKKVSVVPTTILCGIGAVVLLIARSMPGGSDERALLSVVGALLSTIGLFAGIPYLIKPILTVLAPVVEWTGGRESYVAVKNLIAERKKSTLTIMVVAIGITLSVSVTSVLYTIVDLNTRDLKQQYVTDYIVSSQLSVNSKLKPEIKQDLERIDGVKTAMPISVPEGGVLENYDFSRSTKEWLDRNDELDEISRVKQSESFAYYKADLQGMVKERLVPEFDVNLREAAVLSKAYAEGLGVKVGDQLQFGVYETFNPKNQTWNMKSHTFTVAAIVDTMPGEPWQEKGLFLDWSHPATKPQVGGVRDHSYVMSVLVSIDLGKRDRVVKGFEELTKTYTELRWADLQGKIEELNKTFNTQLSTVWSVVGVVMFIGVLGLINTLTAGIQAKQREFAILRAISVTPRQLVKIVLTQSLMFAVLAILIGVVTSCVMAFGFASALDMKEWSLHLPTLGGVVGSILLVMLVASVPLAMQQGKRTVTEGLAME